MKKHLLFSLMFMFFSVAFSQNTSIWQKQSSVNSSRVKEDKQKLPQNQIYSLDFESLKLALSEAPNRTLGLMTSNVEISFPNSEGQMERFRIVEASNMEAELQSRFPEIRSYAGQGIDDTSAVIRFSISPYGFQSMRLSANEPASFIEPLTDDLSRYSVYKRSDITAAMDDFECKVTAVMNQDINGSLERNADDGILRRYRLAMSVTGEYTQYFGGTKPLALAAINATMTRVNGVFENDFNVTMVLIANTDAVIYTNPNTDPYSTDDSLWNNQLQTNLNNVIGSSNYDIGHLMGATGNNGNAGCIGCVCVNNQKGSGYTTSTTPTGDNFDIDFVAHEMGHQFGANHTFTFRNETGTGAQMEPGSGSTIMGYAGITGPTDVQQHSDPYFHARSIEQVTNYIKTRSCQTDVITGNATPTANAGANYTIPKGTPFLLTGSGSDANSGDVLTYCWEQYNTGNSSGTYPSTTRNSGVAFRSYSPTTDTKRYFPRLETIKTGATSWQWEAVPNVARILNFRLTVRDNKLGGASNKSDDTVITVNGTAGPFVVTSPNTNVTWIVGSTQTVTWNVAGTTAAPINCANVDIFLSTDGGNTYPITLATSTPNDGSHGIVVPNNLGFENRIMVKASNNIFFDISNVNFTINVPCTANVPTGLASSNIGSASAVISWNQVPGATYDLRYSVVGNPTWTINTNIVGSTFIVAGLTPSTNYQAQVRSKCSGGSNSAYSSSVFFTTLPASLYCASNGNDTSDEYIGRVQLNTLDNNNSGAGTTSTGYSDFTAYPALKTDLVGGTQYTITITPVWTGTPYNEGYSVWIDYNKDGDFIDNGEQVFTQTATRNTPISGTFTIPTTISYGQTRMRVALKYNDIPTSCESFNYGEVEDYTVNLMYDGLLYTNSVWIPYAPSDTTVSQNALVLDGNYTVNSNIALNNLTVNNLASINVIPAQSIELIGNLINNGDVVLNSNSTEYSSLIVNGTSTGDVVYKRHVNVNASSGGNDLISAPVTGQAFGIFAATNANIVSNPNNPSEKLFGPFDKATGTYLTYDTNVPSEASQILNPAIGYRAASTDNGTFTFKGKVNTVSVNATILNSGPSFKPWNLIGNPYPSYIKLSDFLNANLNEFLSTSAAVYGYDGDASDGWKIMNLAYSLANPNTIITPGQGFLVASKLGGGTMVFNPNFRTIASGNALLDDDFIEGRLMDSEAIGYLQLEMVSNTKRSTTDFYIIENASRGLDVGYDATSFNGVAPNFAIYSHLVEDSGGLDMSIQSVNFEDLNNNLIIPLGVNAAQGQQLTISIANTTIPNDVEIYLEDNAANTFTLLNANDFIFTAENNLLGTGRFFLRFEAPTLNTVDNYLNSILVYATSNPKEIVIKGNLLEATSAHLYDIQGRQVFSETLDMKKNLQKLEASNLSSGVYVIKLQSKSYSKSKKLIIK